MKTNIKVGLVLVFLGVLILGLGLWVQNLQRDNQELTRMSREAIQEADRANRMSDQIILKWKAQLAAQRQLMATAVANKWLITTTAAIMVLNEQGGLSRGQKIALRYGREGWEKYYMLLLERPSAVDPAIPNYQPPADPEPAKLTI